MTRLIPFTALAVAVLVASGCQSAPDPMTEDLKPDQYFQRANDASEKDNHRLAMRYYEAFQAKYPNDAQRNAWASYEIALIHHKLGNDDKALELIDALLAKYENPPQGAAPLPAGPRVLAQKVKKNILDSRKPAAPKSPAPATGSPS